MWKHSDDDPEHLHIFRIGGDAAVKGSKQIKHSSAIYVPSLASFRGTSIDFELHGNIVFGPTFSHELDLIPTLSS